MVAGRKPKEDGQKVTRHALTQEWVDVPRVRYAGERPDMPYKSKATVQWWEAVSTMPHCALWDREDWQFALDTARIHSQFARGKLTLAGELRIREKVMGTTLDARRDLRIRYVDPVTEEQQDTAPKVDEGRKERLLRIVDSA